MTRDKLERLHKQTEEARKKMELLGNLPMGSFYSLHLDYIEAKKKYYRLAEKWYDAQAEYEKQ